MKKDKNYSIIEREKYIREYCRERGWNFNELTTSQLLHIASLKEYNEIKKQS
jgi:hypothetical protein